VFVKIALQCESLSAGIAAMWLLMKERSLFIIFQFNAFNNKSWVNGRKIFTFVFE
jgi:hypothetical protein